MALSLISIQEFVQQIVEAIAISLGIEVLIMDPERNIVAGTGVTKIEVGRRYNEQSLTGILLSTGKPVIAREPGVSEACKHCLRSGSCPYLVVVAYPIKIGTDLLGSIILVATNERQKERMLADEANLIIYLEKACLLIASAINERRVQDELHTLINRYDNVVNSVYEGIIVTDATGCITHINQSAINLLGTDRNFVGCAISEVFPDFPWSLEELAAKRQVEVEVSYPLGGKRKKYFLATVMPILSKDGQEIRGATISMRNLKEVHAYAARLVGGYVKYTFNDIIGESDEIKRLKHKLQKAALTDSTILIRGESGTGKELVAHAVHMSSYRQKGPFIAINCGAIPETLMESELFGYEEGAFTGAKRGGKPGKFELAAGGTLFLDEIGDMPLHLQAKLLRVLETHAVERVGGIEPVATNVRIIAATNRNLEEMVERQEFRGDLYYRLSVIPVFIAPLRERKGDILLLIEHFLAKYSQIMSRKTQQIAPDALETLVNYPWPGNVRELQNAIEYSISMSEIERPIITEYLPQRITLAARTNSLTILQNPSIREKAPAPGSSDSEETLILEAIQRFGSSTSGKEQAAEFLGISLATLYRKLKKLQTGDGVFAKRL